VALENLDGNSVSRWGGEFRSQDLGRRKMFRAGLGRGKKEAPAFDEGEEARLCGGLWTNSLNIIIPARAARVNYFNEIF
jgi:hypothetical protein